MFCLELFVVLRPGIQLSNPQQNVCSVALSRWLSSTERIVLRCESTCNLKLYKTGKITLIVEKIIAQDFQRKHTTMKVVVSCKKNTEKPGTEKLYMPEDQPTVRSSRGQLFSNRLLSCHQHLTSGVSFTVRIY